MRLSSVVAVTIGVGLALVACVEQAWGQGTLQVHRIITTTPFVNSSVSLSDAEGMTYVPVNDTIWLGEDHNDRIYEVDRASGICSPSYRNPTSRTQSSSGAPHGRDRLELPTSRLWRTTR